MPNRRNFLAPSSLFLILVAALAPCAAAQSVAAPANQTPVAYASVNELNDILGQVQRASQNIQADLKSTRIERWKADGATKKQALADVDSIQRNLQSSLPETIAQLNASPEDMGASFKLYRNLDALYDVFGSVAELAGAFGSKDEFQSLDSDLNSLRSARRALAERVQKLAGSKEDELTRLRTQVKTLMAAPPPPPRKIVVDDTAPTKPAAKKRPVKKTPTPAAQGDNTPK